MTEHALDDSARDSMASDVRRGLTRSQKALPPKYFYDRTGSELFEEITRLPEYYLTRTERRLLHKWMPHLAARYAPRTLLELGAGSGEKTRIILGALRAAGSTGAYVPLDISAEFLEASAARLREEFPGLDVTPLVADLAHAIELPHDTERPVLFAFLGSTIGNFDADDAAALLTRVRRAMRADDFFLLGVDLHKDPARIERAYNDRRGVTAEFNRNMLRVLNRELGADFEVDAFSHWAPYLADERRVEMHLIADRDQLVTVPGIGRIHFAAGESIRTEICCKYERHQVEELLGGAGMRIAEWWEDTTNPYALVLARPVARHAALPRPRRVLWPTRHVVNRLEEDTRDHGFAVGCGTNDDRRIGAEVELLLVDAASGAPAPVARSLGIVRELARTLRWTERASGKATMTEFRTPGTAGAGRITFEPGGQLEYSAPPALSLSDLVRDLQRTVTHVGNAMLAHGIRADSLGIDPRNPVEQTTLQLHAERYRRMDRHFAAIGPFGARMMRQTASIQICLDGGADPCGRFTLMEALTPYVTALFANSPVYAGAPTGHMSYRAHAWRSLDPSRTGLVGAPADVARAYTRFALMAQTILLGPEHAASEPFAEQLALGRAGEADWPAHLTTLFPEVRPRGYLELRSCDAIAPEWYAVPLAFVAGIVYWPPSAAAAVELLDAPDEGLLRAAGRCGLAEPRIAAKARELWTLARRGCEALGSSFISGEDLERMDEYARRYSARLRAPANDVLDALHV
jgi:dimethylhistidine N-methyltransferase